MEATKTRRKTSPLHPHRKLLVLGLNHLLASSAVSLWDEADVDGHLFADLAGKRSVILWHAIGWGEVRLSVWWDYDHARHPEAELRGSAREKFTTSRPLASKHQYKDFVGATVTGWVERRTGRHIQGRGRDGLLEIYTRKENRAELAKLSNPHAFGFEPEGQFFF